MQQETSFSSVLWPDSGWAAKGPYAINKVLHRCKIIIGTEMRTGRLLNVPKDHCGPLSKNIAHHSPTKKHDWGGFLLHFAAKNTACVITFSYRGPQTCFYKHQHNFHHCLVRSGPPILLRNICRVICPAETVSRHLRGVRKMYWPDWQKVPGLLLLPKSRLSHSFPHHTFPWNHSIGWFCNSVVQTQ